MSTLTRGTVIKVQDLGQGETTVTYEYEPPIAAGTQNVTVRTLDLPALVCGDAITIDYNTPRWPTIRREIKEDA